MTSSAGFCQKAAQVVLSQQRVNRILYLRVFAKKHLCRLVWYARVFLKRCRDPIRVPAISNRVPSIREIGSLQIQTGFLTFSLKKPWICCCWTKCPFPSAILRKAKIRVRFFSLSSHHHGITEQASLVQESYLAPFAFPNPWGRSFVSIPDNSCTVTKRGIFF